MRIVKQERKSVIFGYEVSDPERYGVVEFDRGHHVISIEEKPKNPKSNFAVVGLYFYTNDVIEIAKNIVPSDRGELEITTVNTEFLLRGELKVEIMNRGYAWLDTGTHESMLDASNFISIIQKRQGLQVGCVEEVAYRMGWINKDQLEKLAVPMMKNGYGKYLKRIIE